MFDYFDYIHESSQEDIDEVDLIYNEYEMTIDEFDSYVQEGVGTKILIGIGLAALIGLLLSAIIKLVSNKSDKSASVAVAQAKYMSKLAKKYGVEEVVFDAKHKKGWMTDLNMRAFELISSITIVNTDNIQAQIEYLEKFDEKDVEKVDVKGKLKEMWDNNERNMKRATTGITTLKGATLAQFDIFVSRRGQKSVPESMSGRDNPNGDWGETGVKKIDQIDYRLDVLNQFIKEFKNTGKQLQDLRKRAAALEKSKPTLMSYTKGLMEKEIISDVIDYVNEAHRIMKESADAIKDAIKIQIAENKKNENDSSDSSDDDSSGNGKHRVNVEDLMNGKEDFNKFMDNPDSQMVFGKRDGDNP